MSQKVIEIVTEKIMNHLNNGVKPWAKPWSGVYYGPRHKNHKTGSMYRGINALSLWVEQEEKAYKTNLWLTAKQAKEQGGQVRKGEKGTPILWAAPYCKEHGKDACPDDCETSAVAWRYYKVFNLEQIDGIEYPKPEIKPKSPIQTVQEADELFKASKAILKNGGGRAFFSPSEDCIGMPAQSDFHSTEGWYSTLLHELTHWTGHKSRLNREFGQRFGDDAYAFEELIAEIGSAFLCSHVGLPTTLENHASYIDHWKRIIANKPSALVEAASKASKAYEYLLELAEAEGIHSEPKIVAAAPQPEPAPVAVSAPASDAKPHPINKKHGVPVDERQGLLERLVLEYMTAPSQKENRADVRTWAEQISISYGTTTYNLYKTQENIGRIMVAMGFRNQLKALQAEEVAA